MLQNKALGVYLALSGASTLFNALMFTQLTLYYIREGGPNPFQLVFVGTVMEITVFLFEVPTGVVADVCSRRLSVIIGTFITGAGFLFIGLVPGFVPVAVGPPCGA